MARQQPRTSADGYCIQVLCVNDAPRNDLASKSFYIENIGKGGFRFVTEAGFELEDRIKVLLRFPDGHSQEVLGRICYADPQDEGKTAYGFSIIEGFYSLRPAAAG